MKAIQLDAPEKFSMVEIDNPGPLSPNEALVKVHRVGVCGTDISGYLGKMPFFTYPVIPGHELGVEVLEVGTKVNTLSLDGVQKIRNNRSMISSLPFPTKMFSGSRALYSLITSFNSL